MIRKQPLLVLLMFFSICACQNNSENVNSSEEARAEGLKLPPGFKAEVYAESAGRVRHIASRPNGDLYLRLASPEGGKSLVAIRDTNSDGIADLTEYFEELEGGTGVKVHQGYLYFSTDVAVYRRRFTGNELLPSGERELLLSLAGQNQHAAKPLAFDGNGNMYITIGAPSNACQEPSRTAGARGMEPCPLLEYSGGIWKFSDSEINQTFESGERYATGIRHAVGISWNTKDEKLYAMQHGRDQLHEFWPELFSQKQSSELPGEEFLRVEYESDFGWPYCYYDWQKRAKVLNPEYGGEGDSIGRCNSADYPLMAFPGHWAPNALEFYHGDQFPVSYKGGAFIAFHGSWNRAPFPQQGYRVVFVPFSGNQPMSGYKSFATGFAGLSDNPQSPGDAEYRPCGLAVGAKGELYISDSMKGRVWRISYSGS
jgi:glucose/arabinose dehydrogenase